MSEVKIIECPRDAWQGLKGQIPAAIKVQYLRALIGAGFKHIDAVSFVSPKAIPQMSDSEDVLKQLDPPDDVEIKVANGKLPWNYQQLAGFQMTSAQIDYNKSRSRYVP